MSEPVISLTSSDEEDNVEPPPPKKKKVIPVCVPQVTLTLVPNNKRPNEIETVSLDSDDELDNIKVAGKIPDSTTRTENNLKSKKAKHEYALITLTDDEEDVLQNVKSKLGPDVTLNFKKNGVKSSQTKSDTTVSLKKSDTTVSLLDSDDSDIDSNETSKASKETVAKATEEDSIAAEKETAAESKEETNATKNSATVLKENDTNIANNKKEKSEATKNSDDDGSVLEEIEDKRSKSPVVSTVEASNESIVIDDSDDDTEKENHCENADIKTFSAKESSVSDVPGPSTSASSKVESAEARLLFEKFIDMVKEKIADSSYEEILPKKAPIIQKYYKKCGTYVNDKAFQQILANSNEIMRKVPNSNAANTAVLEFCKVFDHLKSHVAESIIEIEEDHLPKVKKLEKTMKLLRRRIKQLEEAEVNFDDEEDSSYLILDRYQARLNKVYAKFCYYIRRNPYSGRAIYDRISFVNSKYNAINQVLSKKYKNSVSFPSYYELEKVIEKTSTKAKLNLSEQEIKNESRKCFEYLGTILQKKRRQELYNCHLDFIEFTEDPATKDLSLENMLKKNNIAGKENMEKEYQKYVSMQDQGVDCVSSEDVETSDDSDLEEKGEEGGKKDIKKKKKLKKKVDEEPVKTDDKIQDENEKPSCNGEKHSDIETDDKKDEEEQMETEDKVEDVEMADAAEKANVASTES